MRIVTILGARPQFVKAAMVSRALSALPGAEEILIHTGQHYDGNMSAIFFEELGIRQPDYLLDIHGLPHGAMTGRMLERLEAILMQIKPDVVLLYGDTNSTLAGALAAVKLNIPIAHVEAGLRAFKLSIPEEVNRVMTDHVSEILFTPTDVADENLRNEGIPEQRICHVGDVMYDAALHYTPIAQRRSQIMTKLDLGQKQYFLVTIHRPQNTDTAEALQRICRILSALTASGTVVWPLHPRTRNNLAQFGIQPEGVLMTEPLGFLDMIELERHASVIVTDSGGVQKEAYFHQVPCVSLKRETEWTELVTHGWNIVVPPTDDAAGIAEMIATRVGVQGDDVPLYGSGKASEAIAHVLSDRCHAKNP